MVIVSVYVPGASDSAAGCTQRLAAPVPDVALRASHGCVFEAVQCRVPPPRFAIEIVCAAGLAPAAAAMNANDEGATEMAGAGGPEETGAIWMPLRMHHTVDRDLDCAGCDRDGKRLAERRARARLRHDIEVGQHRAAVHDHVEDAVARVPVLHFREEQR